MALVEILMDFKSSVLVVCTFLLSIAILGVFPSLSEPEPFIVLTIEQRLLFVLLSIIVLAVTVGFHAYLSKIKIKAPPDDEEYDKRLKSANEGDQEVRAISILAPEQKILFERNLGQARIAVLNDSILEAKTDILVSSDDNYLEAKGGVAKAIMNKAGSKVEKELDKHRRYLDKWNLKQGDISITSGGLTGAHYIFHPAIIDRDQHRYPNQSLIHKVVRQSLTCAAALGANSIAFPVLGGGTASKNLTPWNSIQAILSESLDYLLNPDTHVRGRITYVVLYVFDKRDIAEDLNVFLQSISDDET